MTYRALFLIGLAFLAFSIGSLFLLIPLLHVPMHSSGKIPLPQPVVCGGGCGGEIPILISEGTQAEGLVIEYEWPKQLDINGSDSISVALTVPRTPLSSEPRFPPTPTPIGNVSDRGVKSLSPDSLAPEEETNCAKRGITDPRLCVISNIFGNGYKMSATAYMVTTSFDIQSMGPVERSADQPLIEWDWNIFPKSVGLQVINVGVALRWTPTGKGGGTDILRQIWESPIAIVVNKSFIDVGQLSLATVASGVFGTIFTGFSLPWIWEQRRQVIENKKKKKINFCRYCGAENPEDFGFCNKCGKQRTGPTVATISTPPILSSPGLTGDKQSSVGNATIVQETPAAGSSKEDGK
jgi:hypothetical protein